MPERYACAPRHDIARGQAAPAIVGGVERTLRWGLLAPWRGHGGKRGPMIYEAPEDAIASTPVLRNAKPCLVPADGFYAWRKIGSKRVPYYIHGSARVHFDALATTHADDGIESFAIIVVPAAPLVAPFAATMPRVVEGMDGWRADPPDANPRQGELF